VEAQPSAPQYVYANQPIKTGGTTTVQTTMMQGAPQTSYVQQQPGQPMQQPMMQGQQQQGGAAAAQPAKPTFTRWAQSLDWGTHLFMIAFLSFLVMVATSQFCDSLPNGSCVATRGYQVAVGTISFIAALLIAIIYWAGKLENQMAQTIISWCFVLWWLGKFISEKYWGAGLQFASDGTFLQEHQRLEETKETNNCDHLHSGSYCPHLHW